MEKVIIGIRKAKIDYLEKLTLSIRKQIAEAPENIEATELAGEDAIDGKWMDVLLLCETVDKEIVKRRDEIKEAEQKVF